MKLTFWKGESGDGRSVESEDPVIQMLGVGRLLWEKESGDQFVERLRSENPGAPLPTPNSSGASEDLEESIWQRIGLLQGDQFHTVTGKPFTFEIEGTGIWFFREGRRINRKLTRTQVNVAISRCPLAATTEIKDLIDYPYLYALLMDSRIRGEAW